MPIHDQSYRRYMGARTNVAAWRVIARTGLTALVARRGFLGLVVLAWLPFVVRAVQIYASAALPQADFLIPTRETFRRFIDQQEVFLFFVGIYAGAGLIANDRRANALQIYLSKPLTRADYLLGKSAILIASLLFVTWAPAVLLLLVQVLLSGTLDLVVANLGLVPAITALCLVQAVTVSVVILALSSLTSSSRLAGVVYAALTLFSQAAVTVLGAGTGVARWAWLAVPDDLAQIGDALFQVPLRHPTPVPIAVLVIVVVVTISGAILYGRIRAVEVVA